jgi:hypothetical protein
VTEDQKTILSRYFHDGIKSPEDVLVRAKAILQKACEAGQGHIQDFKEELFMRTIFSYHPNHERDIKGQVKVGTCLGHHTFFITNAVESEEKLTEKDAISMKKCLVEISQVYTIALRDFTEKKYQTTPLKKIAQLLVKVSELYPTVAQNLIIQQLVDKMPHKNTSVDSQYLYYRMTFDFMRHSPLSEERIMEGLVDKLCQLDVDIKCLKARRRYNHFSSISKI